MSKQHDTFPNEQPEMPAPKKTPEITQPGGPERTGDPTGKSAKRASRAATQ